MREDRWSNVSALGVSLALHAAAGFALLWNFQSGQPASSGDERDAIVVTLVPSGGLSLFDSAAAKTEELVRPQEATPGDSGASEAIPIAQSGAPAISDRPAGDARQSASAGAEPFQFADGTDVQTYQRTLLVHIERHRRYPEAARQDHLEGVVILRFLMERDGRVVEAWVDRSSGFTILDAEAVAAIQRAQPLPAIPANLPDRLGIALPVSFALR